ncbi:hypothetical protein OH77DRAFT_693274 [Trametes cingulata]|nr:hypothetical protein OH77DRAFT_693274 [Trametes cingulata]
MRPSILLATLLPPTSALSWAHASFWKKDVSLGAGVISDDFAPDVVASLLQASSSLEKYSARPDCFRKAADLVRANCAELETAEDERVKAALSMTLCEIATAEQQSPPMECTSFQVGRDGQPPPSFGGSPGKCVGALSRSAQYWSSYSGYLREIPQLCFAFRRWNDIDAAKDLHRNSTLQSLLLLQHLSDREIALERALNHSSMLAEDTLATLEQLRSSSAAIDIAAGGISEQLSVAFDEYINHAFREFTTKMRQEMLSEHAADLIKAEASIASILGDVGVIRIHFLL